MITLVMTMICAQTRTKHKHAMVMTRFEYFLYEIVTNLQQDGMCIYMYINSHDYLVCWENLQLNRHKECDLLKVFWKNIQGQILYKVTLKYDWPILSKISVILKNMKWLNMQLTWNIRWTTTFSGKMVYSLKELEGLLLSDDINRNISFRKVMGKINNACWINIACEQFLLLREIYWITTLALYYIDNWTKLIHKLTKAALYRKKKRFISSIFILGLSYLPDFKLARMIFAIHINRPGKRIRIYMNKTNWLQLKIWGTPFKSGSITETGQQKINSKSTAMHWLKENHMGDCSANIRNLSFYPNW